MVDGHLIPFVKSSRNCRTPLKIPESVQILLVELEIQDSLIAIQIPEIALYPEICCLVEEFLRLLHESGLRVALRMVMLNRLKSRDDKILCISSNSAAMLFSIL